MDLIKEIREDFAAMKKNGALLINAIDKHYPAFVVRFDEGYGVAIEAPNGITISEHFNKCKLSTGKLSINSVVKDFLILSSPFEEYRYEFASLCAEFVFPGDSGSYRAKLLSDPYEWWERWKALLGNTSRDIRAYDVIAELIVLNHLFTSDSTMEWTSSRMGTHDIEGVAESAEVKSTIKRYGAEIVISGQHQLLHNKPLDLYFCRMEESFDGVSINEMVSELIKHGFNQGKLEKEIEGRGFERGANIRNKKYKLLEVRKYCVDSSFPSVAQSNFIGNKYPNAVTHIEYTIDLDGIPYSNW